MWLRSSTYFFFYIYIIYFHHFIFITKEFSMTDAEKKKALDESVEYFEKLINIVLPQGLVGVEPMEVMRHYNVIRTELAKLYVDLD